MDSSEYRSAVRRHDIAQWAALAALLVLALVIWLVWPRSGPTGPVAPALTGPPPNTTIVAGEPVTLTGTAAPGATVQLLIDDVESGRVTADADGRWSLPLTIATAGPHTLDLRTLDGTTVVSALRRPRTLTVAPAPVADAPPPQPVGDPPVLAPLDGPLLVTGGLGQLAGSAAPNALVEVVVDGVAVGTVQADGAGQWALAAPLTAGPHTIVVRTVDATGALLAAAEPVAVTASARQMPRFAVPQAVLGDGMLALTGSAEPGSTIEILSDDQVLGSVVADNTGNWSFAAQLTEPGRYNVSARSLAADGALIGTTRSVTVTVPETFVPAPSLAGVGVRGGQLEAAGSAEPDATIEIVVDGTVVGTTRADAQGNWRFAIPAAGTPGRLVARIVDDAGGVLAQSEPVSVSVLDSLDDLVQQRSVLATLATAVDAAGLRDALAGDAPLTLFAPTDAAFATLPPGSVDALLANPAALADLLRAHIVDGGIGSAELTNQRPLTTQQGVVLTVAADADGKSINGIDLPDDPLPARNGFIYPIDRIVLPPLPDDITPPTIDPTGIPTFQGSFLTVVGTGEPGYGVAITLNGRLFGRATVDPSGFWKLSGDVADGNYTILATLLDPTGVPLARSLPLGLQVSNP